LNEKENVSMKRFTFAALKSSQIIGIEKQYDRE
jgi:hypothetical protein